MAVQRVDQTSFEEIEDFQCRIARGSQKEISVGMKRHTVHGRHMIYTDDLSIDVRVALLFLLA